MDTNFKPTLLNLNTKNYDFYRNRNIIFYAGSDFNSWDLYYYSLQ